LTFHFAVVQSMDSLATKGQMKQLSTKFVLIYMTSQDVSS